MYIVNLNGGCGYKIGAIFFFIGSPVLYYKYMCRSLIFLVSFSYSMRWVMDTSFSPHPKSWVRFFSGFDRIEMRCFDGIDGIDGCIDSHGDRMISFHILISVLFLDIPQGKTDRWLYIL